MTGSAPLLPWAISRDGTRLVVGEQKTTLNLRVMAVAGSGQRKLEPLLQSKFNDVLAEISPDGRWIAYQSNESGADQIYVRPFPNVNGGRWQVSTNSGFKPVWARSGRELYLSSSVLMSVAVQTAPTFSAGTPMKLFDFRYDNPLPGRNYDVPPDGQRFLVIRNRGAEERSQTATPPSMVVVLNWFEELKARTK